MAPKDLPIYSAILFVLSAVIALEIVILIYVYTLTSQLKDLYNYIDDYVAITKIIKSFDGFSEFMSTTSAVLANVTILDIPGLNKLTRINVDGVNEMVKNYG